MKLVHLYLVIDDWFSFINSGHLVFLYDTVFLRLSSFTRSLQLYGDGLNIAWGQGVQVDRLIGQNISSNVASFLWMLGVIMKAAY